MSPHTIISGTVPHWINTKTERVLVGLVESLLITCGITSKVTLVFQKEASIQKRKHQQPCSITLRPSSFNNPTSLTVLAVGKNPGHDMAEIILNMDSKSCNLLRSRLTEGPFSINPPPETPVNSVPPVEEDVEERPVPKFDADSIALYLSSLQECGSRITVETAMTIARRSTGDSGIFIEARDARYIFEEQGCCQLTGEGHDLLQRLTTTDDATKPGPSEFDRLKTAVIEARAQHQAVKAAHDARTQALATLTHQLTEAREAYQSEELNATTLQGRLQKLQQDLTSAQCKVTGARRHVLDLEEQARAFGTDTPDLIQAERTLQEAEAAYQQLIAL